VLIIYKKIEIINVAGTTNLFFDYNRFFKGFHHIT